MFTWDPQKAIINFEKHGVSIRSMRDGSKTIRIISARQASRKERKAYAG